MKSYSVKPVSNSHNNIGKWQGGLNIQGDHYNCTGQLCRKYKATEDFRSCLVTVKYRVTAIYKAVYRGLTVIILSL